MDPKPHLRSPSTAAALIVAVLLHGAAGYALFSSQTLQFRHANASRAQAQVGVAVTLVSTMSRAEPTPTPPANPQASPPRQTQTATATRPPPKAQPSELPTPAVLSTAPAPTAVAATTSPSATTSAAPAATSAEPSTVPARSAAAAAPSAQAESPTLPGVAVASSDALACRIPQPPYPLRAKRLKQTGTVTLRLTVTATGAVIGAQVAASSGSESLDQAALEAVAAAKCKPGMTNGIGTEVVVAVPVNFSLLN